MSKDETYTHAPNLSCQVCKGQVEIPPDPLTPSKTSFSQPRFANIFAFTREVKANWRLRLFFHGRRDLTPMIVLHVRVGVCVPARPVMGGSSGQLALVLQETTIEDGRDLVPDVRFYFDHIFGSISHPSAPLAEIRPEIRTDAFLVVGSDVHSLVYAIPFPLVHMVTSFDIIE